MKKYLFTFLILICSFIFLGWGSVGHRIINRNAPSSFPQQLNFLSFWADSLAANASNADNRRSWDPNEAVKHYIDIDNYPEFILTGRINHNFDSLVALHGLSFVMEQGILPWAIIKTYDSLVVAFQSQNWNKAMLIAADLGHYLADANMPLHLTRNYNGQYTGQTGIHSRYESTMIGNYQNQIIYNSLPAVLVNDISDYVFNMIYNNYRYVDSVLYADIVARTVSGGSYNSIYYQKLWELTKSYTINFFRQSSHSLASLIYTAWVNAGQPVMNVSETGEIIDKTFHLYQNFPNPFGSINSYQNLSTNISWQSPISGWHTIKLFDLLG
ncbi:MAG: hypothetical protein NZM09_10215, partial [Ignavibacterium sp.]|nr:hypothetical protein [Ignavibacterium sp.]MDW8376053.1 hypothetical protein [Ignavibacteriales bacterium]